MVFIGYIMQKQFSGSFLLKGIIEEIDISKILMSGFSFRNLSSESIDELALSIHQHGLLNPIILRTKGEGYEIVAGVLRFHACKKLGQRKIMSHILEVNDREAFEISLIENLHRKTLDPIEEARAYKIYVCDYGWGGLSELSSKICKSVSYIYKRMSILDLPEEILDGFSKSLLNISAMEELVFVKDRQKQINVAQKAMKESMTIKELRQFIEMDNESIYDYKGEACGLPTKDNILDVDLKSRRSFDKAITTLKIASNKMAEIILDIEDNWIVYEMLMQHKANLNHHIDILIKEKRKLS